MMKIINPETGKELKFLWRHYPPTNHNTAKMGYDPSIVTIRAQGSSQCIIAEGKPFAKLTECESLGLGVAECAITDQFSRRVGRKIALKKALIESKLPEATRKLVWEEYFNMQNGKKI